MEAVNFYNWRYITPPRAALVLWGVFCVVGRPVKKLKMLMVMDNPNDIRHELLKIMFDCPQEVLAATKVAAKVATQIAAKVATQIAAPIKNARQELQSGCDERIAMGVPMGIWTSPWSTGATDPLRFSNMICSPISAPEYGLLT